MNFIIKNKYRKPLFIKEGGDYRSGRQISFDLTIIAPSGDTIERPKIWGAMGGRVWYHKLMPNEERTYKLSLPVWGKFKEAGKHEIFISKTFVISPTSLYERWDKQQKFYRSVETAYKASNRTIFIKEDQQALHRLIDNLIEYIKIETEGRVTSPSGYRVNETTMRSVSDSLSNSIYLFQFIEDEHVIPFITEAFKENKYLPKTILLYMLSKFVGNQEAFETLLHAAQGASSTESKISENSITIIRTASDIRQSALGIIMKFDDKAALDFLIDKQHDNFPEERYYILERAQYFMSKNNALQIYKAYLDDTHAAVRSLAMKKLSQSRK
ncbi:MAG: hypothetical protein AAF847_08430 [Bacteroidota bacterium]